MVRTTHIWTSNIGQGWKSQMTEWQLILRKLPATFCPSFALYCLQPEVDPARSFPGDRGGGTDKFDL
jgi:hypothetical protein